MFAGWTRIDMLLRIYDNAIESLTSSERFHSEENVLEYTKSVAASQKAVLAIHAGLKPDEHDVAFNVARLLHFVLQKIESNEFKDAIMVLENLRSGFTQIEEEARILSCLATYLQYKIRKRLKEMRNSNSIASTTN